MKTIQNPSTERQRECTITATCSSSEEPEQRRAMREHGDSIMKFTNRQNSSMVLDSGQCLFGGGK